MLFALYNFVALMDKCSAFPFGSYIMKSAKSSECPFSLSHYITFLLLIYSLFYQVITIIEVLLSIDFTLESIFR